MAYAGVADVDETELFVAVARGRFVEVGVSVWQEKFSTICVDQVVGVSWAPVDLRKDGDHCIMLGLEKGGRNRGTLNFIGGKVRQTNDVRSILAKLFDETMEEMRVVLPADAFWDSVVSAHLVPWSEDHCSLLVIANAALSVTGWVISVEMDVRPPGCFREWKDVARVALEDLDAVRENTIPPSDYVTSALPFIRAASASAARRCIPHMHLPRELGQVGILSLDHCGARRFRRAGVMMFPLLSYVRRI